MKEIRFDNIFGLDEVTTPDQLDTFESARIKGLYDRYIYDFSIPSTRTWTNLTNYSRLFEDNLGIAGDAEIVIKNFIPNTLFDTVPDTPLPLDYDENNIPIINKNAVMYLGTKLPGLYGEGTGQDLINNFRSGYIEFTIKTDNQNCIIGFGSPRYTSSGSLGVLPTASWSVKYGGNASDVPTAINSSIAVQNEVLADQNEIYIEIKNGKLLFKYIDQYGEDAKTFEILSNKIIADNEWHHIVINIGKPGIIKNKKYKSNKRFVEFYIDGISDIVSNVNDNDQIFFPRISWLMGDPKLTFARMNEYSWSSADVSSYYPENGFDEPITNRFIGETEIDLVNYGIFNPIGDDKLFSGQIHHFVSGFNTALSHEDITLRYTLYKFEKFIDTNSFLVNAEIMAPIVQTNVKRALRLFWNDEPNVNGIELDKNFVVDTISVTHKAINSTTDIYNADKSNNKKIKILNNVKAAFKDNVNIFGPGLVWLPNRPEMSLIDFGGVPGQLNLNNYGLLDSISLPEWGPASGWNPDDQYSDYFQNAAVIDWPFSNLSLDIGDRLLLTNQIRGKENGIWIFNGFNAPLTRDPELYSPNLINNGVVYVTDGIYENTYWMITNEIKSVGNIQKWVQLLNKPSENTVFSEPIFYDIYRNEYGEQRLFDVLSDIDISKYAFISFINYPESIDDIVNYMENDNVVETEKIYKQFLNSIKIAVSNGANLFVSSPKLAEDLGIVKKYSLVSQLTNDSDVKSSLNNPFEIGENADRYFDTNRNNKYHLVTPIAGLTDKETWIMSDFINYLPENNYDEDEWHIKYNYRQFGIQEDDEFIIPGLALRKISENTDIPGNRQNYRGTKDIYAVAPQDILAGTVVTKFGNVYCDNGNLCQNPYDDYATTIIVHNGQLLGNYPINGKIFVNCVEDSYTFSREEYNYGTIQNVPNEDPNETINTLNWQYSTRRLNRRPQNIAKLVTEFGQTKPTYGGGGPLIQGTTNSSYGIIRSETDSNNNAFESDLYPTQNEEIYPIQIIPTLSMTWLGLKWLQG